MSHHVRCGHLTWRFHLWNQQEGVMKDGIQREGYEQDWLIVAKLVDQKT
jgi:hypothetical protein